MRRHPALPVTALLAVVLLGLAGCSTSATPADRTASAGQNQSAPQQAGAAGAQQHDHGQAAPRTPPVAPQAGVLQMRVEELTPGDVEFRWNPGNILLSPGQNVTLKVANKDYMQHNFLFQAAKVNQNLPVGKVTTLKFKAPAAGTYAFWCKYHLQMMDGTITVR